MGFDLGHRTIPSGAALVAALVLCLGALGQGGKQSELEAERQAISARIAQTQALINGSIYSIITSLL